jgi:hypothetical protein
VSPSLPSSPSLRFLKEQAKDILKAHKAGDASSCEVLRKLRRFATAADADILPADVPLKEVQFALAMHYGFASWEEMRKHVIQDISERVTKKCWETAAFRVGKQYVLDAEATALNDMALALGELPDWAVSVRDAMPKYGFELCSHRWVEGIDEAMKMVGAGKAWHTTAGRCGDVPASVIDDVMKRADAVEAWLAGHPDDDPLRARVFGALGQATADKTEAARCFVAVMRQCFAGPRSDETVEAATQDWRARSAGNPILAMMFEGKGLHVLLQNPCGYRLVQILDIYIEMIGGDQSRAAERHSICVGQTGYILRDDPQRFTVTRGYLWGMFAYLAGHSADWLKENKPECAEAAVHALDTVSRAGPPNPLRSWLVASLLKSTKAWVQKIATEKPRDAIPEYPKDLPDLPKMGY